MLKITIRLIVIFLIIGTQPSCVTFAPPSPFMTYGGPKTTPKGKSEAAIALGTSVALFDGAHSGGEGWFTRYKYGITEKTDFGIDFSGASRNDGGYFAGKVATRHQIGGASRLELGIGAADDSSGKSLNTDLAVTIGTTKDKTWNYYTSLRFAYAKGFAPNSITLPGQTKGNDSIPPPNTSFIMLNLGAQGEISDKQKFIFEGGYGYILPKDEKNGPAFYISAGLLFTFGRKNE